MEANYLHRNGIQTQTMSFTSGKGGVGKTSIVTNLAVQLSRQGKKVLILDGDLGMANVDVMFGVRAKHNVYDVISGQKDLSEVLLKINDKIYLIPGGSGIYELNDLSDFQKRSLLDQVQSLPIQFDHMLIDTAPGIDDRVLYLNSAAQEIFVILTPDPSSLTDAYALIKVLNSRCKETKFSIVCNQVRSESEAMKIYKRLYDVAAKFLYVSLEFKGFVPFDPSLSRANRSREILSSSNHRAPSALAISDIAKNCSRFGEIEEAKGGLQFFWQHLVGLA